MKFRELAHLVCLLFLVSFLALPAQAAEEKATVNVALLDMTAVGGHGMMGPRWGMMGMGMISIRIDKSSVKACEIHFAATNWSRGLLHEMLVIAMENWASYVQSIVENNVTDATNVGGMRG